MGPKKEIPPASRSAKAPGGIDPIAAEDPEEQFRLAVLSLALPPLEANKALLAATSSRGTLARLAAQAERDYRKLKVLLTDPKKVKASQYRALRTGYVDIRNLSEDVHIEISDQDVWPFEVASGAGEFESVNSLSRLHDTNLKHGGAEGSFTALLGLAPYGAARLQALARLLGTMRAIVYGKAIGRNLTSRASAEMAEVLLAQAGEALKQTAAAMDRQEAVLTEHEQWAQQFLGRMQEVKTQETPV